jgi:hypothetical protein
MRIPTLPTLLISAMVVLAADKASAQAPGTGTPPRGNTNTLSTGNIANTNTNSNTSSNTNSQFYSGGNTGVNNGELEIYAGADPYQGIIIEGSPSLPQLPGFVPPASNFSQPYKPETFVNGPAFLPKEMTLAEAKECRDSKLRWYGRSRGESASIRLFYTSQKESPGVPMTMATYVGTAIASSSDGPFIAALCEAAYKAMKEGATQAVVDFIVRPKNTMLGIGFGTSGGATGLPVTGTHPYAIAGALGFGTGWSNQKVEGEVMLHLTALRPAAASARRGRPLPQPAPEIERSAATAASPSTAPEPSRAEIIAFHPATKLAQLKRGDHKSRVLEIFATAYARRKRSVVKIEGLRLRPPQRSERGPSIEIGEVLVEGPAADGVRYWLLFNNERLLAWGTPREWVAVAKRYQLDPTLVEHPEEQLSQEARLDEGPRGRPGGGP